jgi:hypothetical protein
VLLVHFHSSETVGWRCCGDLLTLRQLKPLVVFNNNSSLGFCRAEDETSRTGRLRHRLVSPNFAKLAESADSIRHRAVGKGAEQSALAVHVEFVRRPDRKRAHVADKDCVFGRKLIQNLWGVCGPRFLTTWRVDVDDACHRSYGRSREVVYVR